MIYNKYARVYVCLSIMPLPSPLLGCTVDGVSGLVEDLEKVLSSEETLRTNLLHVDTLWSMQSPTSAADWMARLQRKDKENKELDQSVQTMCVVTSGICVFWVPTSVGLSVRSLLEILCMAVYHFRNSLYIIYCLQRIL